MTKRLIIAVVFLFLALLLSVYANFYVLASASELYDLCVKVQTETIYENLNDIFAFWRLHQRGIFVFLKHADADELNRYIALLENYALNNNFNEVKKVIPELKSFLNSTMMGETIKFENIF